MSDEMSLIIIDDNLRMDVNTGIIGQNISKKAENTAMIFPTDEIMSELDKLDLAITDLESSFDSYSTSRLSQPNRQGVYNKAGLITNITIGVIIALILLILLV